ncbi:FeoA family protein [Engelhardtia mirabilis]|uniref:Ferrous iron transport protein A n=1 Tax=Engelhardtia mirabilis TaxID=2528011 RepID=A0A518BSZ3_9BACT|nr:Ferrous iron transport protein A [Planctomycetes bacterium Pla133]QDV04416.1 Ferrous iron transport protein A [Planctomycetes bacterium Pla86]
MVTTTLDQLRPGQGGRLVSLGGERLFRRRLMELGLLPGSRVSVVRAAPLGGVLELEVRGSLLSVRMSDAAILSVEVS